jgi:hydrogenase expression/formation protein HypC
MSVPAADHEHGEVCVTCSDLAEPVRIVAILSSDLALAVTAAGVQQEVSVALVDVDAGDLVLVHAGEAIARLDEGAAR